MYKLEKFENLGLAKYPAACCFLFHVTRDIKYSSLFKMLAEYVLKRLYSKMLGAHPFKSYLSGS